jgi:hypothetical protein
MNTQMSNIDLDAVTNIPSNGIRLIKILRLMNNEIIKETPKANAR